jgi:prepilin-type N-terminal cleavage/methylation domain-containing protein
MQVRKTGLRSKRYSEQAGFTLIELLIVVTLIAVLTTLVVPNVARYRRHAAVAAAQGTAHCLETGLTGFDPQSSNPVDRYPLGIVDQASLITAANQIGCKMSLNHQPVGWKNCQVMFVCPDGVTVRNTCDVGPNVACLTGPPSSLDYVMTLGVPGYPDTVQISSADAIETTSPVILVR